MKRYIIFEKETYYPSGGQGDIKFMVDELDDYLIEMMFNRYNEKMKFDYLTIEIWDIVDGIYVESFLGNLIEFVGDEKMARWKFDSALFDKEKWLRIGRYSKEF